MSVGYEMIEYVIQKDQLKISSGDIVCIHTGYANALLSMNKTPDINILNQTGAVLNGGDPKLLEWVTDSGLAASKATIKPKLHLHNTITTYNQC